jgi:hypothetical protein
MNFIFDIQNYQYLVSKLNHTGMQGTKIPFYIFMHNKNLQNLACMKLHTKMHFKECVNKIII